jgi:hydroxyacylglutathione hydrolase
MLLRHFFVEKIAHSSYLIGTGQVCAVIDPERNVDGYLRAARSLGMKITHILETHLHADFVSGHIDLRERTGATICAPKRADCLFEHTPVSEGDSIALGDIRLDVLETPGHTPEHVCYVAVDLSRSDEPVCVFTGDTMFVGDVGRPDLFPGRASELAAELHRSLHDKLLKLPDYCEVFPAHGAGSLCGRSMGAKWTSTIGYERRFNPALQIGDVEEFIASLTTDMPAAPDHFSRCSGFNAEGPAPVSRLGEPARLEPHAFMQRIAAAGALVLDVRDYEAYGGQHIPNSISIPMRGNFATFAGWTIPERAPIYVVAEDRDQAVDCQRWLWRVGIDRIEGYLEGGLSDWARAGLDTSHVCQLSARELFDMTTADEEFTLLDVRAAAEYDGSHVDGAINIPAPDLRTRHGEVNPGLKTVIMCSSGMRSSLAASILERNGFENAYNLAGGYTGYAAAGFAGACRMCAMPHGPRLVQVGGQTGRE